MDNDDKDIVARIMEHVNSEKLKGSVETVSESEFLWHLGDVHLRFILSDTDTRVEYFHEAGVLSPVGNFSENTCDVIDLIDKINSEDKTVHITLYPFVTSCEIVDKTAERKKNVPFVENYYSL